MTDELQPKIPSDRKPPTQMQASIQQVTFSGPLPAPHDLEKYDKIIHNGAERIMSMAEKEQASRLEVARQDAKNDSIAVQA